MIQTEKNSRRKFIKQGVLAAAGTAGLLAFSRAEMRAESLPLIGDYRSPDGKFQPIPLPYEYKALEPYIDARTMEVHYTLHHKGYADKLNAIIEKAPELKEKTIEEILFDLESAPLMWRLQLRNQGGGFYNHNLFWQFLTPKKDTQPSQKLLEAIMKVWQSKEGFIEAFTASALGHFGSGWCWLLRMPDGTLKISTSNNQDNPYMNGGKGLPILGIDVWEHAYYLKYLNKRADYLANIWNVINWEKVSELYEK